jgi:ADP-L-glycero-D-manno-heptose 6-epimerase
MNSPEFKKPKKKILVTGAAGFIGSRLAQMLHQMGLLVMPMDHLDKTGNKPHIPGWIQSECQSPTQLESLAEDPQTKIEGIFHLGACSDTTETDWNYLLENNVNFSKRLWELAIQNECPFIYASSAATYGDGGKGYSDQEDQMSELKPLNLYGQSKLDFDLWALDQEKSGTAPKAWSGFKFFNVYGFGEHHKGHMASMVHKAFYQIKEKGEVKLFKSHREDIKDGHQSRDFISVEDVCDVLLYAFQKPISRGIYNLGTGRARSFLDLVEAVFKEMDREPQIIWVEKPPEIRKQYQYFTQAEMGKLRKEGYSKPFTRLEEGVATAVSRLQEFEFQKVQ